MILDNKVKVTNAKYIQPKVIIHQSYNDQTNCTTSVPEPFLLITEV